ncbi:hypothetical protein JL106_01755 [Nakamurella sp. YIM 132084]|uniref:Uncharacterized protein n=2 Tax=Nakamurella leprariae TaxID=2803911 RepID=A0A938YAE5_9ACTN|nr:hypothetical protein [Nakamurella leprariae]
MTDPTRGGALSVTATTTRIARDADLGVLTQCTVTLIDPDRALTATLRHLGTGPLPLD